MDAAAPTPTGWVEANHRFVSAALRVTQARLDVAVRRLDGKAVIDQDEVEARRQLEEAARAMPAPAALERLRAAFDLTPFQYDLMVLAAAAELVGAVGGACATLQGDPRRRGVSFGLALWLLPDAHWSALSPDAPLRRWRILEMAPGGLTDAPLRIDERILHEIVGVSCLDERLRAHVCVAEVPEVSTHHRGTVDEVARCAGAGVVVLRGGGATTRVTVAVAALRARGVGALVLRLAEVPAPPEERALFAVLLRRELRLRVAGLVVDRAASDAPERLALVRALARDLEHPLVLSDEGPALALDAPSIHVEMPTLDAAEQRALWGEALGDVAPTMADVVAELSDEFRITAEEIARAGDEWRRRVAVREVVDPGAEHPLRRSLRVANRAGFDDLAQVIVPVARPEDLVLPEAQSSQLEQLVLHVRHRRRVLDEWGFARREARGLGITALFHGPSGTGKTLAAEVIAGRLGLDLVRVDLSQVVNKYVGETEKNLRRIFDAADRGGVVLLFDEADALFGRRGEVKESLDRYANIEVGYLLQRMEAFRGLAVLTTNLKQSLDAAFMRRLRFVVAFPFPDADERRRIWSRSLPAETPREGIDLDRLARLQIAGGNIRNIALHAAFRAAAEGGPLNMSHLHRAARDECARIEKAVGAAELGGWT